MPRSLPTALLLAAAVFAAACSRSQPAAGAKPAATDVDLAAMDPGVNPCQDFYQYACGRWNATHPIPNDQAIWGTASQLQEKNLAVLRQVARAAAHRGSGPGSTPVTREVGTYYAACMDRSAVTAAGAQPLAAALARIAAIASKRQAAAVLARMQLDGTDALFVFGPEQDFKHATREIAVADQGGLGLPDRSYYLTADARSRILRHQYLAHVQTMFALLGDAPAAAQAEANVVLSIETALARDSITNVARRNPQAVYHKMSVPQFESLAPAFDWRAYFAALGAPRFAAINVAVPGFFRGLNAEWTQVPLADWKTYLRWHLAHDAAAQLSPAFVNANFAFYGAILEGEKAPTPRWKRCVESTDQNLGEALGQLYVKAAFSPQAKAHMEAMVGHLETALGQDISSLAWMTPATKKQALIKLHAIANKVAYPDHWRDYSAVVLRPGDFFGNYTRAQAFESRRELAKIGRPVDRGEWGMTPPTVNAYYNPLQNEIVFPAGILQPPFFNPHRDDASNYGAVGVVMGHELTHGFDDEGRQFGPHGNLRDWWTPADAKAFEERTACLVNEYAGFSPLPGVHLNGRLTLGENTADNGGARIAYMAMEAALAGQPDTKIDGFDRAQRFFIAYGQVWCQNVRPQTARLLATVDPHSPGRFRVNGVVQNLPQFAQAFHCGPGAPMTAGPKACRVW